MRAYLLKESLDRWSYRWKGAMLRYLQQWIDQLRWQRLKPFQKLAWMLLDHLEGVSNHCRTKVPMGAVEAVNSNAKALMRRRRGMCVRFCSEPSIQFFSLATGKSTTIAEIEQDVDLGLAVSPDERTILYAEFDLAGSDLMLVENFR